MNRKGRFNLGYLRDMKILFSGISKLYGTSRQVRFGSQMDEVKSILNASILVENGRVLAVTSEDISDQADQVINLNGAEVMPGFVDSHTHTVFAVPREEEFVMRLKGASYEEIAAAGGGILNSAQKLRRTSEDELFDAASVRVRNMIAQGTTALEIKSGYGLSVDAEIKMLRVIKKLKESFPITIRATFLGAHAFPKEYKEKTDDYVDLVVKDMLPIIAAEELADHIDVFCERGFFSSDQANRVIEVGAKYGLPSKIHGNQLAVSGGVQVAVRNQSWSVDHLEHCTEVEWNLLKNSFDEDGNGTMPVVLPGVSYYLDLPYAPAREMIDYGLPVVLATDFNPGSSPVHSLQTVQSLACTQMKMTPEEAFNAVTINAARSLRLEDEVGSITVGSRADFLVMNQQNALQRIPYYLGQNLVKEVYIGGVKFDL